MGLRNGTVVGMLTTASCSRQPRSVDRRWRPEILECLLPSIIPSRPRRPPNFTRRWNSTRLIPPPLLPLPSHHLPRVDPILTFVVRIDTWECGVVLLGKNQTRCSPRMRQFFFFDTAKFTFENSNELPTGKNGKCSEE